jgi:cold shock CspA family protein
MLVTGDLRFNRAMNLELDSHSPNAGEPKKPRRRGRAKGEKIDQRGRPATGRISRIQYGQGHGFIRAEGRDVFFHRKDVSDGSFNALEVGDRVELELVEDALTGPRAGRVVHAASSAPPSSNTRDRDRCPARER